MSRKQKKYHFIYKTTNIINSKFYVGMHSTDNLEDGYLGSGKRLWRSIKKYGKEHFKIEILEFFGSREDLKNKEEELITESLLKEPLCMNLMCGGEGGSQSIEKLKKWLKSSTDGFVKKLELDPNYKKIVLERLRKAIINNHKKGLYKYDTFTNKKHTEETKKMIGKTNSLKQSGYKNSQFNTCWIYNNKESKKIKKEDLEKYLKDGWIKGRKING